MSIYYEYIVLVRVRDGATYSRTVRVYRVRSYVFVYIRIYTSLHKIGIGMSILRILDNMYSYFHIIALPYDI